MIMPPIKLKTLHWAKPFILILLITIVTYWMKYYRMNDKEVQHIQQKFDQGLNLIGGIGVTLLDEIHYRMNELACDFDN